MQGSKVWIERRRQTRRWENSSINRGKGLTRQKNRKTLQDMTEDSSINDNELTRTEKWRELDNVTPSVPLIFFGAVYNQTDEKTRHTWKGHEWLEGADWMMQGTELTGTGGNKPKNK